MFVLQHVWTRWTKAGRSAQAAAERLALPSAWPLRPPAGRPDAWLHEIRAIESEGFLPKARSGELTRAFWEASAPAHAANLTWRMSKDAVELSLLPPWPSMRSTRWPEGLPRPIFSLSAGQTARIDWNARFRASAGESNRGYFYDAHTLWLAVVERPEADLFTAAQPYKHLDLRTQIY